MDDHAVPAGAVPPRFAWLAGPSLAECLARGRDNFLVLRLCAALLVLLGHSYALLAPGLSEADPARVWLDHTYTHFIGVMAFFVISGYLITLSWQRNPRLGRYLVARALRILPALGVCMVLTAFVLGPIWTSLPLASYLSSAQPYAYVAGNFGLVSLHWQLPGVFNANPVTDVVNGSLWTLPVEAMMYLGVAVLGLCSLLARRWLANLALAVFIAAYLVWPLIASGDIGLDRMLVAFFAFGALCCVNREHVPISLPMLVLVVFACWLARDSGIYRYLLGLAIGYATLWFAYAPRLPTVRGLGDWSYGTYLWGFPVQQALISFGVLHDPLALFACALAPTLLLAALSWHGIERPALRLKRLWHHRAP
jgi:peptidoglycan/LPS O-acetylase OafA/YrhL